MLRSMTGFARAERATPAGLLAWEIRSVNHRYLEVGLRLPEDLRASESEFRRAIAAAARRGKVDAAFYVRPLPDAAPSLALDADLLERLIVDARAVRERLGPEGRIDAVDLLRWPGVVKEAERDPRSLAAAAASLLSEALTAFTASFWPMRRWPITCSISSSFAVSPCSSLPVGMPVQASTTSAICSAPTSSPTRGPCRLGRCAPSAWP